ncbi:DNA polymerase zeta catalytic subunit-like [Fagus crenata]
MADTQADSNVFRVRIVSINYYMAAPISGLDFCYSSFQGGKVNEVPVIRIYGSTPTGQKTCLHIHKVLPYLYVPCADISLQPHKEELIHLLVHLHSDAHTQAVFLALEKGLKLKGNAGSKRQHVHGCSLVRARKFYGYHSSEELFGGTILDRSLQPHESHIPFILQFMIDYNLYGMGHMHLSEMKFRHPVLDTFSPRKSDCIGLQNQKMDKFTCMANDFQADPNCDASLSSPIWISSTTPVDWICQFPSEFKASTHQDVCCVKRQSQFKNYSSLSQTHLEVKMVQSLVPIWEEYERTGMRDVAMPSDPSKPLPNDVLRTLSLGLEFQSKLIELCGATENTLALNPLEKNGNLVGLGHTNPDNRDGESLKYSKEKDIMRSLSPQGSIREEEIPTEGRDTSIKPLSIDEMRTSAIIETSDPAGEDINFDDELVCETILSPLLPATTIDKVLEKANMDYESESQKECQDILDSIDDLSDFEEKMIPQIDGFADDLFSVPCVGSTEKSSEIEMRSEFEGSSELTNKHKRKQYIWGSLPFSMMQKVKNDSEPIGFHTIDACVRETKDPINTSFLSGNVAGNCAGRFMKNADTDVHDLKESCTLVGCSLDKNAIESLNLRQSLASQQTNFQEAYEVKVAHSDSSMYGKLPLLYSSDSLSQASRLKDGNFGSHEKVSDEARIGAITGPVDFTVTSPSQVHTGPWICKPKTIDSAASMGHREIDNVKEFGFGVTAIANERFQQIGSVASSCLQTGMVECGVFGADCSMYESGHEDEPSLVWVHDKSFENLAGTNVTTDSMGLQNQNCSGGKQVGDFILSGFGSSETVVVNTQEKCTELIGMTFCKKPPIADWTDGASENASFTLTTSNPKEDNFGGSSEEKELMDKHARINDSNSDQFVIGVPTHCQNDGSYLYLLTLVLSPPSTDSVYRWLLCDEKGSPGGNNVASVDSSPLKASSLIGTQSFLPDDCDKDLPESSSGSHVKPILDHLYQENPRIFDREMSAFGDGVTTIMQDMSQISRPDGKSKPTPLSQSGFRDLASVGGGQQLTLLSIEVQAESRGDLRPNPRFDAINVIALAIQNDTDSIPEVYVLLRSKTEAFKRSLDGTSGCKMLVFSEEKYLFSHFMKIVCSSDSNIIMGWDIQGGSLGFLAERASHLGIGLLNNISRTPSEIKIAAGDLDIPEKGNFDNLIPEQSNTDLVILEDAIIEDEWGRTHASGVHVGGRIVLNIWRLMRGEVKLNMYTIEAVAEAVLRQKIPSFHHKVASQPAMECLPLVMESESGFHADPVVVLDFQSLYPSMIIAYNLCFSTCLGKVASSKANTLGQILHRVFNARQLALKLISNATYGYTAAGFSGRMPCAELADSIVQCGRSTLEKAISFVNAHDKWKAEVIYGDTDSLFVLLKGHTVKESFQIGNEIAFAITAMNPKPVTLKMEKTAPVFDAKGIKTVCWDACGAIAKTLETSLRRFFEHQDISEVKAYLQCQWTRILSARVSLQDFVFAKEVRLGTYCTRGALHLSHQQQLWPLKQ